MEKVEELKHPLYEDTDPETNQIRKQLMQSSDILYIAVMSGKGKRPKKVAGAGIDEKTGQIIGLEAVY